MSDHYCCKSCGQRYDECRCTRGRSDEDYTHKGFVVMADFGIARYEELDFAVRATKTRHETFAEAVEAWNKQLDVELEKAGRRVNEISQIYRAGPPTTTCKYAPKK